MNEGLHRARFYAILDTAYVPRARWLETARTLVDAGVDLLQVRAKRESSAERESLVREILPLFTSGRLATEQPPPYLIINDDVELCARTPGAGLHIGQEDTPPAEARARIGSDRLLGWSTHSWEQAQAAMRLPEGVLSYFCVGPVFATATKPDYPAVGLALVKQVAAAQPALPWFAIGGIKRTNLAVVRAAGASRVVVVSEVLLADAPAAVIREYRERLAN